MGRFLLRWSGTGNCLGRPPREPCFRMRARAQLVILVSASAALAVWMGRWRGTAKGWAAALIVRLSRRGLRRSDSFQLSRAGCMCTIVSDEREADDLLQSWLQAGLAGTMHPVFGLDVEWVRGQSASLMQLSCGNKCLLLRLCHMPAPPRALALLLRDERVLKVGVGVHHDMERLERWMCEKGTSTHQPESPSLRGAVDIVPLARTLCGCEGRGLAQIALDVLGEKVHKATHVRCSNWEEDTLSHAQAEYAAEDANLPLKILLAIHGRSGSSLDILAWATEASRTQEQARSLSAAKRKAAQDSKSLVPRDPSPLLSSSARGCDSVPNIKSKSKPRKALGHVARSSPLYDGWLMLSPQGDTMARIKESRARRYVSRGLAIVDEELRQITLTFQPSGLGNAAEPWLVEPKANACVGCGAEQAVGATRTNGHVLETATFAQADYEVSREPAVARGHSGLIRWSVLPPSMRRLLPAHLKSHDSHDIVLLCGECHKTVEAPYARWRRDILAEHGIAFDTARYIDDPHIVKVRRMRPFEGRQAHP